MPERSEGENDGAPELSPETTPALVDVADPTPAMGGRRLCCRVPSPREGQTPDGLPIVALSGPCHLAKEGLWH